MSSASWFDPSNFRHLRLALKISLNVMANAVLQLRASLGFHGSLPHGGEGAFDGVGGADVFPMLGGEITLRGLPQVH